MPDRHVLHEGDALALDRAADDQQRALAAPAHHRFMHRRRVVAVDFDRLPAEGLGLRHQRVESRVTVAHPLEAAEIVEVHQRDKIVELEVRRHHHRFPARTFLEFAVRQQAVDHDVRLFELLGIGLPGREAEAMAERTGRGGNSRRLVIGMGAEPAVGFAIGVEIGARQHTLLFQDHVLDHAAVALRHQKDVAIAAAGLAAHQAVVK